MAAPFSIPPNVGAPGQEQFVDAQVTTRNFALEAYIGSLLTFRGEFLADEALETRNGFDNPTMAHFKELLNKVDLTRRLATDESNQMIDVRMLFPDLAGQDKNVTKQDAGDFGSQGQAKGTVRPDTKQPAAALRKLRYALDGSDANIKLNSQLNLRNELAGVMLGLIDKAIVDATRCEDRFLTNYITPETSVLLFGSLQALWVAIQKYGGSDNRVTIVGGTRPSEEPRGPAAAINAATEQAAALAK